VMGERRTVYVIQGMMGVGVEPVWAVFLGDRRERVLGWALALISEVETLEDGRDRYDVSVTKVVPLVLSEDGRGLDIAWKDGAFVGVDV